MCGYRGVVLEDHGCIAILGSHIVDDTVADLDGSRCDLFQTGHHPQHRGLPAPGRTDQNDEFLVGDFQADAVNHLGLAECFDDILKNYLRHRNPVPVCGEPNLKWLNFLYPGIRDPIAKALKID